MKLHQKTNGDRRVTGEIEFGMACLLLHKQLNSAMVEARPLSITPVIEFGQTNRG